MKRIIEIISIGCFVMGLSGCWATAIPIIGGTLSGINGAITLMSYTDKREPESSGLPVPERQTGEIKRRAYEEGFRTGMKSVAVEFRTKEEMNKPYVWRPPLVSEVDMPARIVNGVMIPAHTEPVIVRPGYWIRTENVSQD
ncbi:MAG: hypothetical protein ACE5JC_07075 [Candidatus Zixiibacteriota bacterium]